LKAQPVTLNLLEFFLLSQVTSFLFIFVRVGSALMLMPGFGDSYVSPRFRLLLALAISVVLTPLLGEHVPPLPGSVLSLGLLIISEVLIGGFLGMIARTLLSAVHVAGTLIAYQSSLAMSAIFDPVTGSQTAVMSNFLTITAVTVMFALNLHHLMIATVVESYLLLPPGQYPMIEDMTQYHLRLLAECFALGVMLAAPHIVFSIVYYLMGGLMARLMPNFQTFYVMMAPQIIIAFIILLAVLGIMMEVFAGFSEDQLLRFSGVF
jgi:flagellar biosynthetic protein FliR